MESKSRGRSWSATSTITTLTLTLSRTTTMLIKISRTTVAATRRRIAAPKGRHTANDQREERPLRRRRRSKVDLEVERVSPLLTRRIKTKHAAARKAKEEEDPQKALANENKSERIQLFFQRKSCPHSWNMTHSHTEWSTHSYLISTGKRLKRVCCSTRENVNVRFSLLRRSVTRKCQPML